MEQITPEIQPKHRGGWPKGKPRKGLKPLSDAPLDIKKEIVELEKRIAEREEMMLKYQEENKIEFFEPIEPYQSKILEHLHNGKKVIALVGGNGIGKTTLGAVISGSGVLGIEPWTGLDTIWGRRPIKVRVLCQDWEKHAKEVIVPKLKEYLPRSQYETHKNNVGVESVFNFRNKSSLELITNKQSTSDHEGWEGDLVWADEPFDRDKFVANLRGLRRPPEKGGMGVFLLTMTAVSEAWILDEIIRNPDPAFASVTEIPQSANPYLSEEFKRIFRASLRESEKIARIDGGWLNLVGLVWRFNADRHLIEDFEIPVDWPVVPMIDFHPATPNAISFFTTDPRGFHYVIDEVWGHSTPEQVADTITRVKKSKCWRIEEAYIDPLSKGDVQYVKNRFGDVPAAFEIIKERLGNEGIELQVASKDKDSGIINVEKMLMSENGMPVLFFFRHALGKIEKEGTVWEIQRWTYDDHGKPKDDADHFMENLYRYSLVGNKYSPMVYGGAERTSEIDFNPLADNYGKQAQL